MADGLLVRCGRNPYIPDADGIAGGILNGLVSGFVPYPDYFGTAHIGLSLNQDHLSHFFGYLGIDGSLPVFHHIGGYPGISPEDGAGVSGQIADAVDHFIIAFHQYRPFI